MQSSGTFLQDKEEDKIIEIDYDALVDLSRKDFSCISEVSTEEKEPLQDEEGKKEISFYCRDCKKMVEVKRVDRSKKRKKSVHFECMECGGKNVLYGTKKGLEQYFHLSS